MVETAISKGIDEIWVLEHTHCFKEFDFLYEDLTEPISYGLFNKKKEKKSVREFLDFAMKIKQMDWPIKIKFGLEVCYFPETESQLRDALASMPELDFKIGSVHFALGAGIDLTKEIQEKFDINELYKDYFQREIMAVKSRLFDTIGHPGLIKLFGLYPDRELYLSLIEELAVECEKYSQKVENNTGSLRYGFPYGGMSPEMLEIFLKHNVKFHKSSDAHVYKDIGRSFHTVIENL